VDRNFLRGSEEAQGHPAILWREYGEAVRVVQIGGQPKKLNGYSMELCGGTHVRSTSEIGVFRVVKEEAIAAGTRRIEAVAGDAARVWAREEAERQHERFETLSRKSRSSRRFLSSPTRCKPTRC